MAKATAFDPLGLFRKPLANAHVLDGGGWWRVAQMKANPKKAEVHVYAQIGVDFFGEGVDPTALIEEMEALDVDEIDVRINSPGGSAWDGLNIANAMMRHPAKITTYVDGLAASAASMIMVAGDKVVTSKYGSAMLHNAKIVAMGGVEDLRAAANQLDKLNGSIAMLYADRAGGDAPEWARAMKRESWYNADEMVAAGLAHEVDASTERDLTEQAAASAMALVPAQFFAYSGRPAAPAPTAQATPSQKGTGNMADKKDIAKSLGLPDDASDDDIRKALAAVGLGPEDDDDDGDDGSQDDGDDNADADAGKQLAAAGAQAKAGDVVQLDKATYDSLISGAQAGAKAMTTLQAQADARVVDKAIDEGRIMPSRRDHFMALMTADRADTTDLLTKRLQPGVAVPLNEAGHSVDGDASAVASVTENATYKAWEVV